MSTSTWDHVRKNNVALACKLIANKFALERFDRFEHLIETECVSGGRKYAQSVKIFSIICTLIQRYYLFSAIHKKKTGAINFTHVQVRRYLNQWNNNEGTI